MLRMQMPSRFLFIFVFFSVTCGKMLLNSISYFQIISFDILSPVDQSQITLCMTFRVDV